MTDSLLPDLGTYIRSEAGKATAHVGGILSVQVIDRYLNEYVSLSGTCSVKGVDYCATFDFERSCWSQFFRLLQTNFYVDLSRFSPTRHSALKCDPVLLTAIDVEVAPKESVQSQKTDERFVPLKVISISNISLVPTIAVLKKRHAWWIQQSRTWCGTTEPSLAMAWGKLFRPSQMTVCGLDYGEFIRNTAGCCLAYHGLDAMNKTVETLVRHGFIRMAKGSTRLKVASSLRDSLAANGGTYRQALINMVLWYIAGRILAHSEPDSIEHDIAGILGTDGITSIDMLTSEGRYCLARNDGPALRDDEIEKEIRTLTQQHVGIRKILEARIAAYPKAVWDHPEVSAVTRRYVAYDLLRQVYQAKGAGPVSAEAAERCEENVQVIGQWLRQCAPAEIVHFGEGLQAMRTS